MNENHKSAVTGERLLELIESFSARELAPGLYVVGTPIGNLEDISLRALRVLQQCDLIACEDTRKTQKLLNYYSVPTRTVSYHQHNETGRSQELIRLLHGGAKIALVSDAGMPGISDPGAVLIAEALQSGIPVIPVPGPSALISALVASGLETESFRFLGFLPAKTGQRRSLLEQLQSATETLVFYEAPHRIIGTLEDVVAVFGAQRYIVIARELTKIHEEYLRGPAGDLLQLLRARDIKGEITLMVRGYNSAQPKEQSGVKQVGARIRELIDQGTEEKAALKAVAKEFGLSKSEAYREWQRARK